MHPEHHEVFFIMKKIKIGWDKFALVDDEDFDMLSEFKWRLRRSGGKEGKAYAVKRLVEWRGGRSTDLMHRIILGLTDPKIEVDHRNGFTLDNQKHNLRPCTHQENMRNRKSAKGSTSKYLGVHWNRVNKKWSSSVTVDKKQKHLGWFDTELEAAIIYNIAARKNYGEFASPNKF